MQVYIEIAARAPVEKPREIFNPDGTLHHEFRFDLRHVFGDYHLINIPAAFNGGDETAARAMLHQYLVATFAKYAR